MLDKIVTAAVTQTLLLTNSFLTQNLQITDGQITASKVSEEAYFHQGSQESLPKRRRK